MDHVTAANTAVDSNQLPIGFFLQRLMSQICLVFNLGGGFKYVLFSPLLGEMIQFDEHIFQRGWFNHQLDDSSTKCLLIRGNTREFDRCHPITSSGTFDVFYLS